MKRDFRRRVNDEFERREDLSYGELADLTADFDNQLAERGIELDDEEYTNMFVEFCDMYACGQEPDVDELVGGYRHFSDSRRVKDSQSGTLTIYFNGGRTSGKKIQTVSNISESEVGDYLFNNCRHLDWENLGDEVGYLHYYANIDGKNYFEAYFK